MSACVISYFWGKYQTDPAVVICLTLDSLEKGGYIKTKINENGEEEIIKLDDQSHNMDYSWYAFVSQWNFQLDN